MGGFFVILLNRRVRKGRAEVTEVLFLLELDLCSFLEKV